MFRGLTVLNSFPHPLASPAPEKFPKIAGLLGTSCQGRDSAHFIYVRVIRTSDQYWKAPFMILADLFFPG